MHVIYQMFKICFHMCEYKQFYSLRPYWVSFPLHYRDKDFNILQPHPRPWPRNCLQKNSTLIFLSIPCSTISSLSFNYIRDQTAAWKDSVCTRNHNLPLQPKYYLDMLHEKRLRIITFSNLPTFIHFNIGVNWSGLSHKNLKMTQLT